MSVAINNQMDEKVGAYNMEEVEVVVLEETMTKTDTRVTPEESLGHLPSLPTPTATGTYSMKKSAPYYTSEKITFNNQQQNPNPNMATHDHVCLDMLEDHSKDFDQNLSSSTPLRLRGGCCNPLFDIAEAIVRCYLCQAFFYVCCCHWYI